MKSIFVLGLPVALAASSACMAAAPAAQRGIAWPGYEDAGATGCDDLACVTGLMKKTKASPEAIAFAEHLSSVRGYSPAWAVKVIELGKVDLVLYDCSQCHTSGFALAGGSPDVVVDASVFPQLDASLSGSRSFIAQHPNAMLTRGDAYTGVTKNADGSQRFLFINPVADCEACNPYAAWQFAFDFDATGKLTRRSVLGQVPMPEGKYVMWAQGN